MIRVLIVDDEPLARRGVRVCLRRAADVAIVGECATGRQAIDQVARLQPDLMFLDIQMPGMNGFEVISEIGKDRLPLVIFLTAFDQYALPAFSTHAIDYVLKPIDDERFAAALERARERLRERTALSMMEKMGALLNDKPLGAAERGYLERLTVKVGSRTVFVNVADVGWIKAGGDYVTLHVGAKTYLLRETLDNLERRLNPKHFRRVHRSAIVALNQIQELRSLSSRDYMIRLKDGSEIRASRRYRDVIGRL